MNLLPQAQKEIIGSEVRSRFIFVIVSMAVFWLSIFLVLEYAMILYLKVQVPTLEALIEKESQTELSKETEFVEVEIGALNDMLEKSNAIQIGGIEDPSRLMARIGEIVPSGAHLEQVSFMAGSITLSGVADNRSDVLTLKETLEKEGFCPSINAPVVPLREQDVRFTFSCFE